MITAHFIPAALLFVAGYAGCQALGAAWLGIAALLVSGTAPAGALAAIADLAPAESPACAAAACALCSTLGAAGLLAANYFVTQALHGSVSVTRMRGIANVKCYIMGRSLSNWSVRKMDFKSRLKYHFSIHISHCFTSCLKELRELIFSLFFVWNLAVITTNNYYKNQKTEMRKDEFGKHAS